MKSLSEQLIARLSTVVLHRDEMHDYQWVAAEFLKKTPLSALFIDMGLGKTVISLTCIVDLLMLFDNDDKILIVGPLKVVTETWPTEIGRWNHTAPFTFTVIREDEDDPALVEARARGRARGREVAELWELTPEQRDKQCAWYAQRYETIQRLRLRKQLARSKTSIHIISRDSLEWLCNFYKGRWPYRTVIIDESSSFKDQSTARFKALAKIRRTPGLITRMHLLTATPAAETYEHLWAQIYLLDLGQRLGKNITNYRSRYFSYNQWKRKYTLHEDREEEILDKLKDITLVMKAKDYLTVEEPTFIEREVHMTASQMQMYKTMEKEFVLDLPDGTVVEAKTAAALSAKLLQIASGVLYDTQLLLDWDTEEMTKVKKVHHIHDHKIQMLQDIVEEAQGQPLLVVYHFKSSLDRLQKAFPKATTMDRSGKAVKPWNAKKLPYPMMFIHPQSGGHGLNLQHGGHILVFFDLPWSLEYYLQVIGRLARQGQTEPVLVYLLLTAGTLDKFVYKSLVAKEDAQDKLFSILKRKIKKYRQELLESARSVH